MVEQRTPAKLVNDPYFLVTLIQLHLFTFSVCICYVSAILVRCLWVPFIGAKTNSQKIEEYPSLPDYP